jgi:hypothetical protein
MRISWFAEDNEESSHIGETEGELPKVGEEVYINDYREKGQIGSKYVVKIAYHKVMLSTFHFDAEDLAGVCPEDHLQAICDLVAKEEFGVCLGIPAAGQAHYATQSGEVILAKVREEIPTTVIQGERQ